MDTSPSGAHYRAHELTTLGHEVRLMPPSSVKGYIKRGKTDAADAAAICKAVSRLSKRFVPLKCGPRWSRRGAAEIPRAAEGCARQAACLTGSDASGRRSTIRMTVTRRRARAINARV